MFHSIIAHEFPPVAMTSDLQWRAWGRGKRAFLCKYPIMNSPISLGLFTGNLVRYKDLVSSWWRHQMETFSALLAICAVKGQWRGALMFSFNNAWINGWVNNREAGYLRPIAPIFLTLHWCQWPSWGLKSPAYRQFIQQPIPVNAKLIITTLGQNSYMWGFITNNIYIYIYCLSIFIYVCVCVGWFSCLYTLLAEWRSILRTHNMIYIWNKWARKVTVFTGDNIHLE